LLAQVRILAANADKATTTGGGKSKGKSKGGSKKRAASSIGE
jgi:hypothetical protein